MCYKTEIELAKTIEDKELEKARCQNIIGNELDITFKLKCEREEMDEDEMKHKNKIEDLKGIGE